MGRRATSRPGHQGGGSTPGATVQHEAPDDADLFTFPVARRRFSDEELISNLREFAHAFPPTRRTMGNFRSWPGLRFHDHTVVAQLGGWIAALRRAEADHEARRARGPSLQQVVEDIRRFAYATPIPARTLANFKKWRSRKVSVGSVAQNFGNWYDALTKLDIAVPGQTNSQKHSDEELLEAVERVSRWCKRPPSHHDLERYARSNTDGISYGTICNRFGPVKPFLGSASV